MSDFVEQEGFLSKYNYSHTWTILTNIEQSINDKIIKYGKPLKDWNINIFRGVLTGLNEAFIIDKKTRDALINEDSNSAKIIRPILRGRDIQRYSYVFNNLWLINTHNGIKEKALPRINIDDYPAVKKHLQKYYMELLERADQGDTPFNLRNCAYLDDFSKPKMVWKRIGSILRFCLDTSGTVCLDSTCFATGEDIPELVAILNTHMGNYLFCNSPKTGTGDLIVSVQAIEPICIPELKQSDKEYINHLLNEILLCKNNNKDYKVFEEKLESKVFDLYNLDKEEREYVNEYVNRWYRQ